MTLNQKLEDDQFELKIPGKHSHPEAELAPIILARSVKLDMRIKPICLLFLLALSLQSAHAQGTVPTFVHTVGQGSYTLVGRDPAQGGTTTIPTVLVPVTLSFEAKKTDGKPFVMDAAADVSHVLRSPIFSKFAFPSGDRHAICRRHAAHYLSQS